MQSMKNGNYTFPCVSAGMYLILQNQKEITEWKLPLIAFVFLCIPEILNDRWLYQRKYKFTKLCQSQARVRPQAVQTVVNYPIFWVFLTPESNDIFRVNIINSWDFLRWKESQKRNKVGKLTLKQGI